MNWIPAPGFRWDKLRGSEENGAKRTFYESSIFDELVKSRNSIEFFIPANPGSGPRQAPESSYFKMFWTPAFAGVMLQETFYEIINFKIRYLKNISETA